MENEVGVGMASPVAEGWDAAGWCVAGGAVGGCVGVAGSPPQENALCSRLRGGLGGLWALAMCYSCGVQGTVNTIRHYLQDMTLTAGKATLWA